MVMYLLTANIKNNPDMPDRFVRADARLSASRFSGRSGLAGFQEIGEKADHAALRAAFPGDVWRHLHTDTATPLVVGRRWTLLHQEYRRVHRGMAGVSPDRGMGWAVLEHPAVAGPVAFLNTHYVSGAWNAKPKSRKAWRKRMWLEHHDVMSEVVQGLAAAGATVLAVGDFNRLRVAPFAPGQVWLAEHGIDKALMVPPAHGRHALRRLDAGTLEGHHSDHAPLWVALGIR